MVAASTFCCGVPISTMYAVGGEVRVGVVALDLTICRKSSLSFSYLSSCFLSAFAFILASRKMPKYSSTRLMVVLKMAGLLASPLNALKPGRGSVVPLSYSPGWTISFPSITIVPSMVSSCAFSFSLSVMVRNSTWFKSTAARSHRLAVLFRATWDSASSKTSSSFSPVVPIAVASVAFSPPVRPCFSASPTLALPAPLAAGSREFPALLLAVLDIDRWDEPLPPAVSTRSDPSDEGPADASIPFRCLSILILAGFSLGVLPAG